MYYVLFGRGDAMIVTSWPVAQEACRDKLYMCKRFTRQQDANTFFEKVQTRLAYSADQQECYTDGAAWLHKRATGAAFFGPGDARNRSEQLKQPPFTSPRAELWAALLALRTHRPLCIMTDSELVLRAFAEDFPESWANQDLLQELRALSGGSACRCVQGHKNVEGNLQAHRLCNLVLRQEEEQEAVAGTTLLNVGAKKDPA